MDEKDRPQFQGDPHNPVARSIINNRNETYYPNNKRQLLKFSSFLSIFLLIVLDLSIQGCIFYIQSFLINKDSDFDANW